MSIASEITRIKNNIAAAFTAISTAGGTVPQDPTSEDLATSVNSIVYDFKDFLNSPAGTFTVYTSGTSLPADAFHNNKAIGYITMPNVTSIGQQAFIYATNLANTALNDKITTIGASAFQECRRLALTSLPSTVTSIGSRAFHTCTSMTRIKLPKSLTTMGDYVFNKSTALTVIDLTAFDSTDAGFAVPTMGPECFHIDMTDRKFYFKDQNTLDAFAAATNWASYANDFTTDPVPSAE